MASIASEINFSVLRMCASNKLPHLLRMRHFSVLFKSVCRTHSHRMNSVFSGGWGIVPSKQKRCVCRNTRIACGGLSVMIGH